VQTKELKKTPKTRQTLVFAWLITRGIARRVPLCGNWLC